MIFDLIVVAVFLFELRSGYREGFAKTVLKTAGYIAGAIAGLYFALQYEKNAWVVLAILLGAALGTWAGSLLAKALKITVIRGPLAWLNSWIGALLSGAKIVVLAFLIGTVLLWAPWPTGQNAVAESKVYLQLNTHAPAVLAQLRERIEEIFAEEL